MKKYVIPVMLFVAACNSNEEPKKTEVKPEDAQIVEQVDNTPQPYFSGVSASPAGTIDIISDVTGKFIVKYTLDGVSAEVSMKKEPLVVDGKQNVKSGEVKLSGEGCSVSLNGSDCQNGTHTCVLIVGEKVSEFCGKYAD